MLVQIVQDCHDALRHRLGVHDEGVDRGHQEEVVVRAEARLGDADHPHKSAPQIVQCWAEMLTSGQDESDPAVETWARLVTFIAQASVSEPEEGEVWFEARDARSRALIACRRLGENFWRVLTDTDEFAERLGRNAVQLYGRTWASRGWVQPGKDSKSTTSMYIPNGVTTRVLRVPMSALHSWAEVEDEEQ